MTLTLKDSELRMKPRLALVLLSFFAANVEISNAEAAERRSSEMLQRALRQSFIEKESVQRSYRTNEVVGRPDDVRRRPHRRIPLVMGDVSNTEALKPNHPSGAKDLKIQHLRPQKESDLNRLAPESPSDEV